MFADFLVDVPQIQGKIVYQKKKEGTYVLYEYDRIYIKERKYTNVKRTTIGKLSDVPGKMYPNENYQKFFAEEIHPEPIEPQRSSCLKVGSYIVIRKVFHELKLDSLIHKVIGKNSGLFLDLAAYSIVTEDNAAQYYPDYAYEHPLFTENMHVYSDSTISEFLQNITVDQRIAFLNQWNKPEDHNQRVYVSYDSTNKDCQAGDVEIAEIGHPKSGHNKPVFNYAVAYDETNRKPLFYEEYEGSIVDMAQLKYTIETITAMGYTNICMVLDRGYFGAPNIHEMDRNHIAFLIMMKGQKKLARKIILAKENTFEKDYRNLIDKFNVYGTTVKMPLYEGDDRNRYFHLYYSASLSAKEQKELTTMISTCKEYLKKREGTDYVMPDRFKEYFSAIYWHEGQKDQKFQGTSVKTKKVNEDLKLCGYFIIVSSEKMDAKEAILLYKSRDASEKLFRADKSYLGNQAMRVCTEERTDSKIFISFIALIARQKMYTSFLDKEVKDKKENYLTVPAAVKELDKIQMIKWTDNRYHLDHAITKTQREILSALDISTNDIKREISSLQIQLKQCEPRKKASKSSDQSGFSE